ncbi:unnamed protein product [Cyprideis torosa]|uniref:Uncharacterized protein n=1 Tax=Cyprideis torosa TaxID=163714 RepID=A0A7R8ZPT3_9CRUS|nr:unnamed protein product [Cyprideis torosa]CAG0894741.1 unnamed protein product [Cyprideis torosa]
MESSEDEATLSAAFKFLKTLVLWETKNSSRPRPAAIKPPNIMATPGRRERFPPLESPTISRRPVRDDGSAHNRAVVSILDLPSTPPAADLRVSVGRSAHPATYCCELIRNGGRRGGTFNVAEWPIPTISLSIASTEALRALEEELKTSKDSKKRQTHLLHRSLPTSTRSEAMLLLWERFVKLSDQPGIDN